MTSQQPQPQSPFLYSQFLPRVSEWVQERGCVALLGGKNLGKTTVLAYILQNIEKEGLKLYQNGRSPDLEKELCDWHRAPQGPAILIDDYDCTSSERARDTLFKLARENRCRIYITVYRPDAYTAEYFGCVRLDPWKGNWQTRCQNAADMVFARVITQQRQVSPEILGVWKDTICRLSGGHPALIHTAYRYFSSIYYDHSNLNTDAENRLLHGPGGGMDEETWLRVLRVHLEDQLIDRALPLVRHVLRQTQSDDPEAVQQLLSVAQGDLQESTSLVRQRLRETGLVYSQPDGRLEVAGELIKEWIPQIIEQHRLREQAAREAKRSSSPSTAPPPPPTATPQQEATEISGVNLEILGDGNYEGNLKISAGETVVKVPLSGGPWRVAQNLRDAGGEPVSLDLLAERANLSSETAVRSAIQRLQKILRNNGLDNVIDNVRGQGYRLSEFPKWTPPTA